MPVKEFREDRFVVMATAQGIIKKTELSAYGNPRQGASSRCRWMRAIKLIGVQITDGQREILLGTQKGIAIRFKEEDVRPMGRTAHGVRGITLEEGNEVIGMETITPDSTTPILTVTEGGYGKRTPVSEYRVQGRGGKGIISVKTNERNGLAVGFLQVRDGDEIMMMAAHGKILRCKVDEFREIGRNTQGVRILDLDGGRPGRGRRAVGGKCRGAPRGERRVTDTRGTSAFFVAPGPAFVSASAPIADPDSSEMGETGGKSVTRRDRAHMSRESRYSRLSRATSPFRHEPP